LSTKQYYTYILRNKSGNFYIGVTNDLIRRTREHKRKYVNGFAEKYNIDILVYYELYGDPMSAITREKQLKNWSRKKKILLITKMNPKFEDLFDDN
jgi:putative endonuclease